MSAASPSKFVSALSYATFGIAQFLTPAEFARSLPICSAWHKEVQKNEAIWKWHARNVVFSYPMLGLVHGILEAFGITLSQSRHIVKYVGLLTSEAFRLPLEACQHFDPGKHLLTFIPTSVNVEGENVPLTLDALETLAPERLINREFSSPQIIRRFGAQKVDRAYFLLMGKKAMLQSSKGGNAAPTCFEIATSTLLHYISTGEPLFSELGAFAPSSDTIGGHRVVVGDFGPDGLLLNIESPTRPIVGSILARRFPKPEGKS